MAPTEQEISIFRALSRLARLRLNRLCPDLTPMEWRLLNIVSTSENGITVSSLAKKMELSTPALSRMMKGMESRGLIRRQINPDDRRNILVTITPEGEKAATDAFKRFDSFFCELLDPIDPNEFEELMNKFNDFITRAEILLEKHLEGVPDTDESSFPPIPPPPLPEEVNSLSEINSEPIHSAEPQKSIISEDRG